MKLVLSIVLLAFFSFSLNAQKKTTKPNIIFIFADDLGYGEVGCYGQQKIETPNIDKLAKNGMRFTQFYAGSTVCAPSRSSFLTGLHTGHTAVRGNISYEPEGQTPLPDSVITFANMLQQNGYATAAFGKWGLGYITTSGDPNKKGFDKFYGYNCQTLAHDYYPDHLWNNHERIDLSINLKYDSVYSADMIHHEAMNYIKQSSGKPFFLYLPYTLPHGDVIVPHDSLYNYYKQKFNDPPLTGKALKPLDHNMNPEPYPHAGFAAMVSRLDKYVGEIVKLVKEKGIADNTLIIFTSDNGPHKENGGDPEFFNSNGIYKGIKRDLYEGGIRVPFIAYWSGKIKPAVNNNAAALWDMYPSFLQLAGVKYKNKIDGISLVPSLLQTGKQKQHDYFYWEFHENNGRQAVHWGKWKGVRLAVNKKADSEIELYDLEKDPQEMNNIALQNAAIVRQIESFMKKAHHSNIDWPLLPAEIKQ
ncbi:MAG: arylsulfatase [Bacteroidetes bacterium]|nr:MAG: arylsulfatase [Bacteroidota bacterium]